MVRFRKLRGESTEQQAELEEAQEEAESMDDLVSDDADAPEAAEAPDEETGGADDLLAEVGEEDDLLAGQDEAPLDQEGGQGGMGGEPPGAVKELAARMAVLQSNLENFQSTRGDLESKLQTMEDRLLRLGSLAEAVSSEYNPFIARSSPDEPTWEEQQNQASDAAHEAAASEASPPGAQGAADASSEAPGNQGTDPTPPPAEVLPPQEAAPEPTPEPEAISRLMGAVEGGQDPAHHQGQELEQNPAEAMMATGRELSPGLSNKLSNLEENFMLLEWVGLMLRRVGRANLLDLLEYYEGLGWLDHDVKRKVVRVAVGVDAPEQSGGTNEWRGDVELHERSLITIERLNGRDVTVADIEGLRMDMRRLFGE
ncbi:MAG: FlaD/FlaE family flagellar protein [Candidatus Thermoplasmatota archaeon]|nr:FlaD/FlaE family flagellar protein [Candidatus Thermoplasmatota archaeon]